MFETFFESRRIATATLLWISLLVAACGGSGDGGTPPGQATGTVALLLTDLPTDDVKAINFDVVEATLIGDQGQQSVYSGNTRVNLLDLENFSQPIAVSEVAAGTYTKLRLQITNFEIIDNDDVRHTPRAPANGRIDLLQPDGIEVIPGRVLVANVDMDAHKSIHLVQTGSDKYRLRPVVRVQFMLDGLPDELVRIEGAIVELGDEPGEFVLCSLDEPETCFDVSLAPRASVFGPDGAPVDPIDADTFAVEDMVVVIGTYIDSNGDDIPDIAAIVVEQGPAEQVRGIVTEIPNADGLFLVIDSGGTSTAVELQSSYTRIFGAGGEALTTDALQVGQGIEVDGVFGGDPEVLRAALIVLDADDVLQLLSGTIAAPVDDPGFVLATTGGDICVQLIEEGVVTLVNSDGSEMMEGDFTGIQVDREADVYGKLGTDGVEGCFQASEVVVTIP